MAKKTKEQELNLFYLNDDENKEKAKSKKKRNRNNSNNKINQKSKNIKNTKNGDNQFSFDDEIIIGVTRIPEKEEKLKDKKVKNNKKGKKEDKQINKNKKKIESKKNENKQKEKNNLNSKTQKVQNKTIEDKKRKIENRNIKTNKKVDSKIEEKQKLKRIKKFRIIKYTLLILLFLTLIICTMFSPLFNIKNIVIDGNKKLTKDEIMSLSGITLGENTYKINKFKVINKIKQNAYIENVKITRKLPSNVTIEVEERKATFMIEYAGSYVYINNQGYMLEISSQELEVPIIQGAETPTTDFVEGNRLCTKDLEKLSTVLKIKESAENNDIANLITRIDIEDSKDYKIIMESKEKTAYLGDSSNLSTKMLSVKVIMERNEGNAGEIFVNMDLNNEYPMFRKKV